MSLGGVPTDCLNARSLDLFQQGGRPVHPLNIFEPLHLSKTCLDPGFALRFPLPDVPHIMDVACFGAVPCGDEELYHNKGIDRLRPVATRVDQVDLFLGFNLGFHA